MLQHELALRKANIVRMARAETRYEIRRGERTVAEVLSDHDDIINGMRIEELLESQRHCGKKRTQTIMNRAGISARTTLGALSARQRMCLIAQLGRGTKPALPMH